jgi:hypothetical protein
MNEKFTKGAWKVFTKEDSYLCAGKIGVIEDGDCIVVADCNDWLATEKRHNAALIAAAPEMYAMLKQVAELVNTDGMSAIQWIMDNANDVSDLLAKARGEA